MNFIMAHLPVDASLMNQCREDGKGLYWKMKGIVKSLSPVINFSNLHSPPSISLISAASSSSSEHPACSYTAS